MPKKILVAHIITRMIKGGAQDIALNLIAGLNKNNYESTLIAGSEEGSEGTFWPEIKKAGIKHKLIPELVREISPLKDIIALLKLAYFLKKKRFRIVHSHTSKAGFIGSLAAKLAGIPVIIYLPQGHIFYPDGAIPGVSGNRLKLKIFFVLRRFASRLADKVIALTWADKKEQVNLGLAPADKYTIIPNGVDLKKFTVIKEPDKLKKKLNIIERYPVLGIVGRLSSEKGHQFLFKALKRIISDYPNTILLVVGDGVLKGQLELLAKDMGLEKYVCFLGLRQDIPDILSIIDIFIQPSLYEAQSVATIEAMSLKKPVVVSKVGGMPGVVDDGQTGFLVPPKAPQPLAEAILKIANDKKMAEMMGEAGHQKVVNEFNLKKMITRTENLYETLLSKRE